MCSSYNNNYIKNELLSETAHTHRRTPGTFQILFGLGLLRESGVLFPTSWVFLQPMVLLQIHQGVQELIVHLCAYSHFATLPEE